MFEADYYVMLGNAVDRPVLFGDDPLGPDHLLRYIEGWAGEEMSILTSEGSDKLFCGMVLARMSRYSPSEKVPMLIIEGGLGRAQRVKQWFNEMGIDKEVKPIMVRTIG